MLSNLILYAGSFVRAGAKEWKKRLGNIVAPNVMVCINLLGRAGIRVRSLITDEGMHSIAQAHERARLIKHGVHLRTEIELEVEEARIIDPELEEA